MKEKTIYVAKLTTSSIFSFIKINVIGAISSTLILILGFIILSTDIDPGHSGHVSAIPYLVMIFAVKPISSILFYITLIASPLLFFFLGNKYILSKVINKVLKDKSEKYIYPILDKILIKIKDNKDNLLKNGENYNDVKKKIIQQLKNENENRLTKKIVEYGLKKVKLDDVDFRNENLSIVEILKSKIIQVLQNISEPSRQSIWILLAAQWIILLLIWILPY
jgi:hypothetical protein